MAAFASPTRRAATALLAAALAACASAPPADPDAALATAAAHLERVEVAPALDLLQRLSPEAFAGDALERYKTLLAQALAADGQLWQAFRATRTFEEEHPFSSYRGAIQDLEFRVGEALINSDWSLWFFANDANDGQLVLEHFVVRYPQHPNAPDALRLLGEKAFSEGDYATAHRRFRELVLQHPRSEWVALAKFRIAMASFEVLVGPRYDLAAMQQAHRELADFLAAPVENPQFAERARAALAQVREWLGEKHVAIADFYRRIGNPAGEQLHLEQAVGDFGDTAAGSRAAERLAPAQPSTPQPSTAGTGSSAR